MFTVNGGLIISTNLEAVIPYSHNKVNLNYLGDPLFRRKINDLFI